MLWFLLLSLILPSPFARGQVLVHPKPQDPLMQLMLSQPPIDVTSPVVPEASFDPPQAAPGEEVTYRVTFNALEESVDWPGTPASVPALRLRAGGHGQMLMFGGTNLQPRTMFNFHLRAPAAGRFSIPSFQVRVYGKQVTVPAAQLEVSDSPTAGLSDQRLIMDVPTTNLFVGQPVRVRVQCPPGGALISQGAAPLQIQGDGFLVDQTAFRQRFEARPGAPGRINVPSPVYETLLTPISAGKLSAFAQGFFTGRGNAIILNGAGGIAVNTYPYTLLDSDPVEFQVRPLPREGQLPGFTGAVGIFMTESLDLSTNVVRVGEPLRLSVRVRGQGNLARLVPPPPPSSPDWQVFAGPPDTTPPQIIQAQGFATLNFALVPLKAGNRSTPAIPFSCFDPDQAAYADLSIPPAAVEVLPGPQGADLTALAKASAATPPPEKEPVLSGLAAAPGLSAGTLIPLQRQAWYACAQVLPAGAFLGLFVWDRRRRFAEEHPEIIRRRRAKRALRRERRALQRAARRGDAPRVAATAISALRVGCAPYFPAEPRALVGADILSVLPETERAGRPGEVVRQCFALNDSSRFAAASADASAWLALEPDLQRVLQLLEDRL